MIIVSTNDIQSIQLINNYDWGQMSDILKALEFNINIQDDVSPRQLRWDSWGMWDEKFRRMTLKMKMIWMKSQMKRRNLQLCNAIIRL